MKKQKRKPNSYWVDASFLTIRRRRKKKRSYYGPYSNEFEAKCQIDVCMVAAHG